MFLPLYVVRSGFDRLLAGFKCRVYGGHWGYFAINSMYRHTDRSIVEVLKRNQLLTSEINHIREALKRTVRVP